MPGRSPVRYAGRVYGEEEMANLAESAVEFWLTSGRWHRRLEEELAAWYGVAHARLVNSGSSANLVAVAALTSHLLGERRLRPGDEVITVAAGFPTTVAPHRPARAGAGLRRRERSPPTTSTRRSSRRRAPRGRAR